MLRHLSFAWRRLSSCLGPLHARFSHALHSHLGGQQRPGRAAVSNVSSTVGVSKLIENLRSRERRKRDVGVRRVDGLASLCILAVKICKKEKSFVMRVDALLLGLGAVVAGIGFVAAAFFLSFVSLSAEGFEVVWSPRASLVFLLLSLGSCTPCCVCGGCASLCGQVCWEDDCLVCALFAAIIASEKRFCRHAVACLFNSWCAVCLSSESKAKKQKSSLFFFLPPALSLSPLFLSPLRHCQCLRFGAHLS